MDFRHRLQHHTSDVHEKLESQEQMEAYSHGRLTPEAYLKVVGSLASFWHSSEPGSHNMDERYYAVLESYRKALQKDLGHTPRPASAKRYDEIAFFYLLLGSSHGAQYMLKGRDDALPKAHLEVLAQEGKPLWRDFMQVHLENLPSEREDSVLESSVQMFNDLYAAVDSPSHEF